MDLLTHSLPSVLFIGSWIFALIEFILLLLFIKGSFKIGIPIFKITVDLESDSVNISDYEGKFVNESEGKFFFDTNRNIYFRSRISWNNLIRLYTPFPCKVIANLRDDNFIDITGRVPLGTSLFFLFFIGAWIIATVSMTLRGDYLPSLIFGLIGLLVWGLIVWVSYRIEKQRLDVMVAELLMRIT